MLLSVASLLLLLSPLSASLPSQPQPPPKCAPSTIRVRKEWGNLTKAERKSYTDAVLCLQHKPSLITNPYYNTRSRYDDFVAIHINQTLHIHTDGVFLPWHREFVWLYETALRNECNYTGTQPYWNWPKWSHSLHTSPLFDGSPYSLSGDGLLANTNQTYQIGNTTLPHGTGGGCVTTGPFKNYTIIYGPFSFNDIFIFNGTIPSDSFRPNPRCFSRDLNAYVAERGTSPLVLSELLASTSIAEFNTNLDLRRSGHPSYGVHLGGHYTLGPVGSDLFASPADPAFWLHHAMLDRVWDLWQQKDLEARTYGNESLSGGSTTADVPPSADVTQEYVMNWDVLGGERRIEEVMAVGRGEMCFSYD